MFVIFNNKFKQGSSDTTSHKDYSVVDLNNFMHNPDDWSFIDLEDFEFMLGMIYFTFTSLSTVGFGDFYPVADEERIFCSFLLLFGVAIFAYT